MVDVEFWSPSTVITLMFNPRFLISSLSMSGMLWYHCLVYLESKDSRQKIQMLVGKIDLRAKYYEMGLHMNTSIIDLILRCQKTNDIKTAIREFMIGKESVYPKEWKLFQKAYHEIYLGGQLVAKTCPVCGKELKFRGLKKGYATNCSFSCRNKNPRYWDKYHQTCNQRYGKQYASQSVEFRQTVKNTCIDRYGVDNVFKNADIQEKQKATVQKRYGVDNVSKSDVIVAKIKQSHQKTGRWCSDESLSELEKYRLAVQKITKKSYHDYFYQINPDNLPRSRYQYHLDHIFSVEEGFKNNIPPEVIGHHTNLRMLWHLDNSKKNTKCHKTISQLYEDYTAN